MFQEQKNWLKKIINSSRLVHIRRPPTLSESVSTFILNFISPTFLHFPPHPFSQVTAYYPSLSVHPLLPFPSHLIYSDSLFYLLFRFSISFTNIHLNFQSKWWKRNLLLTFTSNFLAIFFFFFKQFRKVKNNYKPTIKRD